jgi:pyruvate/2-oxoglutarate dehydrogenase complex dihydrolipoamide dehydrogenase (E3) component
MRRCDFIAIGGGSAGLTAASRVARAGQRTALVDHGPVGGLRAAPDVHHPQLRVVSM